MGAIPTLTVTSDFTKTFNDTIKRFKRDQVLIGIPESQAERKDENSSINNATLLAMNNFGSPANNIPARPVMEIGIRNAQDQIAEEFKKAAVTVLSQGTQSGDRYFDRAGMIASNSVKKAINSQEGIAPPAESTLESRKSKGFNGTKSLIVTAQMRNAITHVVKPWR